MVDPRNKTDDEIDEELRREETRQQQNQDRADRLARRQRRAWETTLVGLHTALHMDERLEQGSQDTTDNSSTMHMEQPEPATRSKDLAHLFRDRGESSEARQPLEPGQGKGLVYGARTQIDSAESSRLFNEYELTPAKDAHI